MRWILIFLCPPLAVLACGKPFQAVMNVALCFMFFVPAVLHAFSVCHHELMKEPA